jgi:hypothetical protein
MSELVQLIKIKSCSNYKKTNSHFIPNTQSVALDYRTIQHPTHTGYETGLLLDCSPPFSAALICLFNSLLPNDIYICHTTLLTSRRCPLNIYSRKIHTEYFKRAA